MIADAVNAKALSTYMGHANISITLDRYGHLMPGNEAQAAKLLDAYLDAARVWRLLVEETRCMAEVSYEDARQLVEDGVRFVLDCEAEDRGEPTPTTYPPIEHYVLAAGGFALRGGLHDQRLR